MFTHGFEMVPALLADLRHHGRLLWRRVDPATPVDADTPESTRWHLRMGHRANIVHALMVGERQVGFIGMVFDNDLPPGESKLELAHTLCQPITLALELARLSRLAQRGSEQNAVLAERSRLAREIHDGIAQSFLAIQMQLDTMEPGKQDHKPVLQALDMARHGLTEARRAVAALRPQELLTHDLPRGVQRLLAQLAAQGAVQCVLDSPPAWQCLPPEVEDHLFRIVQEAANNVLKHARARHLRVELSQAAGEATVLIADDGVGFDVEHLPAGHGFGLESMQQRAQLIGARIDWLSRPGKGTQVLVSWSKLAAPQPSTALRADR
jgi:signal transduction histidine kinase